MKKYDFQNAPQLFTQHRNDVYPSIASRKMIIFTFGVQASLLKKMKKIYGEVHVLLPSPMAMTHPTSGEIYDTKIILC